MRNLHEENIINTYQVSLVANPFPTNNSNDNSPIKRKNKCLNALSTEQTGDGRIWMTFSANENSSLDNQHMRFELRGPDRVQCGWDPGDNEVRRLHKHSKRVRLQTFTLKPSAHVNKLTNFPFAFSTREKRFCSFMWWYPFLCCWAGVAFGSSESHYTVH